MVEIKYKNILGGKTVSFIKRDLAIAKGKYKEGQLLEWDAEKEQLIKCTEKDKLVAIYAEDETEYINDSVATVYMSGIFNRNDIELGDIEDNFLLDLAAQKVGIYFTK